jgi:CBS domain-containing protein
MLVRSILAQKGTDVVTVDEAATIDHAARLLAEHRIGALVIAPDDRISGILSERDIVQGVADRGAEVLDAPVAALMTTVVATCGLDDNADDLMATMTEQRIRHVPVVDGARLVGIISIGDVVKHRVAELQEEAQTLHDYLETGR